MFGLQFFRQINTMWYSLVVFFIQDVLQIKILHVKYFTKKNRIPNFLFLVSYNLFATVSKTLWLMCFICLKLIWTFLGIIYKGCCIKMSQDKALKLYSKAKKLWEMVNGRVIYKSYAVITPACKTLQTIDESSNAGKPYVLFAGLAISCLSLSSSLSRCCSFSSCSFCFSCCSFKALFWEKQHLVKNHPS